MIELGTTDIGKMCLGETEIAKAYLGESLVYDNSGGGGGGGDSYITNGLVFHLDGINKGTTDTSKWVDLVGGVVFTEYNGATVHGTDCLELDGTKWLVGNNAVSFARGEHTIEIAGNMQMAWSKGIILFPVANNKASTGLYMTNYRFTEGGNGSTIWEKNQGSNGAYTFSTNHTNIIRDMQEAVVESKAPAQFSFTLPVIGSIQQSSLSGGYNGKIYSIRIYNRLLSINEMLQNQQVDNTRFNLGFTNNT